jgi:uncharacterized protein YegP (UPF0339 family)
VAKRALFTRSDGRWAWRLEADNGRVIATDGRQGYENESDARSIADRISGGEFKDAEKRIIRPLCTAPLPPSQTHAAGKLRMKVSRARLVALVLALAELACPAPVHAQSVVEH